MGNYGLGFCYGKGSMSVSLGITTLELTHLYKAQGQTIDLAEVL